MWHWNESTVFTNTFALIYRVFLLLPLTSDSQSWLSSFEILLLEPHQRPSLTYKTAVRHGHHRTMMTSEMLCEAMYDFVRQYAIIRQYSVPKGLRSTVGDVWAMVSPIYQENPSLYVIILRNETNEPTETLPQRINQKRPPIHSVLQGNYPSAVILQ